MKDLIEDKLIPYLSLILGVAICCSTSAMSISYTLIAILVLFKRGLISNLKNAVNSKFIIGCIIFYLVFLIGSLWSIADSHNIFKMLIRIIGFLLAPLFLVAFQTKGSAKLFLQGFVGMAVVSAILSIITFIIHQPILYAICDGHWVVFHGHILHNAFIAVATCFLLWFIFDNSLTKSARIYLILAYIICFIDVMFVVNGRTGQFMLLAMNALVFLYRFRVRGLFLLFGAVIIVAPLLWFSPAVQKGISDYKSDTAKYEQGDPLTSMGLRKEFHKKSLELIQAKPILGYGTGSFHKAYQAYTGFTGFRATTNPHCDLLWVGVELGALGMLAFIALLVLGAVNLLQLQAFPKCMGLALMFGYILASLQNSFFIDNVTGLAFIFIMIALISDRKIKAF